MSGSKDAAASGTSPAPLGINGWILYYRLRDAREGIARNAWASLAAVLIILLALLLLGGVFWANTGISDLAAILQRQVQVRVFLQEGTDPQALARAAEAVEGVAGVRVVTAEETYDQLAAVFSGRASLREAFPENPFPDSLSVTLRDAEAASGVVESLTDLEGVEEVIYGQGYAEPLLRMADGLRRTGLLLGVLFLAAAVLMTSVALHLAILSREAEIRIQQWMGVTPWGIRSQFMLEGFLLGLLSASIAAFLFLWAAHSAMATVTSIIPFGGGLAEPAPIAGLLFLAGPVLGMLGGGLASQRLIRAWEA